MQAHWTEVRRHSPLYLSGVEYAPMRAMEAAGLSIGLMLQPGARRPSGRVPVVGSRQRCFSQGAAFDEAAWFEWLASLPQVGRRRRCLFAVAPDVLADADATWRRSAPWLPLLRGLGIPVALVAQNGADGDVPTWEHVQEWDVLFRGRRTRMSWLRLGPHRPHRPPPQLRPLRGRRV